MQELSPRWKGHESPRAAPAVRVVPHDRMTDRREVDTNLMRTTRVQVCAQQIRRVEPSEPHEVRPCSSPSTDDRHALSVSRVTRDGTIDRQAILIDVSPGENRVPADDSPSGECGTKGPMRAIGLGDEQQSRRVLVEPVDQTLASGTAAFRERTASTFERVDESASPMTGRRMHDHPGRFVHNQNVVIFKHYIELNRFR